LQRDFHFPKEGEVSDEIPFHKEGEIVYDDIPF
jgi:hypothetical protein